MDYKKLVSMILEDEAGADAERYDLELKRVQDIVYAELPNGVKIFNSTPHPINFYNPDDSVLGNKIYVVPTMKIINAGIKEEIVKEENGVTFVKTTFVASPEGRQLIARIKEIDSTIIIVGSIIAAQAYPGDVVAMTPSPGFERVPPAQKRMNPNKFTIFTK